MNYKKEISQADFERIEKYIFNQMMEDEKIRFENELKTNPVLKSKYNGVKDIIEGIESAGMKEKLNQFHSEMEERKGYGNMFRFNWKPFSIAASVVIVTVVSILFYTRPTANERLFNEYYNTDPGLVTAMSAKGMNYEFERGMVDYKTGDFQLAIDRWEPLLAENPSNDTLNYFLGISYLELRNTPEAIPRLEKVAEKTQGKFTDEANWYLALAYLLEGQKNDAIRALNNTDYPLKPELLTQLEKE